MKKIRKLGCPSARKTDKYQDSVGTLERMANEKLYQAEAIGSGTFIISKPKRKKHKLRQSRVKSPQRGARK